MYNNLFLHVLQSTFRKKFLQNIFAFFKKFLIYQGLKRHINRFVSCANTGHMLKKARIRNLLLVRKDDFLFLFRGAFLLFRSRDGNVDVLRIRRQLFDMFEQPLRFLLRIERKPYNLTMIGGKVHRMKSIPRFSIRTQII